MAFTVTKAVTGDKTIHIEDVNGDGSLWRISYDMRSVDATFIEFAFTYTKDGSSKFDILNKHTIYSTKLETQYTEMIVDAAGIATELKYEVSEEGSHFLFLPVGFTSGVAILDIEPDVASGTDTLAVTVAAQNKQDRR